MFFLVVSTSLQYEIKSMFKKAITYYIVVSYEYKGSDNH